MGPGHTASSETSRECRLSRPLRARGDRCCFCWCVRRVFFSWSCTQHIPVGDRPWWVSGTHLPYLLSNIPPGTAKPVVPGLPGLPRGPELRPWYCSPAPGPHQPFKGQSLPISLPPEKHQQGTSGTDPQPQRPGYCPGFQSQLHH